MAIFLLVERCVYGTLDVPDRQQSRYICNLSWRVTGCRHGVLLLLVTNHLEWLFV